MLEPELKQLRDHYAALGELLDEFEKRFALPLPAEPPFEVVSYAHSLQDRAYKLARLVGEMKQDIRNKVLQNTLASDF